ncbi:MAG: AAA family ATPase, partial [Loktanella sp.]|nr:AAA family ATPase [Loktanella sp.]
MQKKPVSLLSTPSASAVALTPEGQVTSAPVKPEGWLRFADEMLRKLEKASSYNTYFVPRMESARMQLGAATPKVSRTNAKSNAPQAEKKAKGAELDALLDDMFVDAEEILSSGFDFDVPSPGAKLNDHLPADLDELLKELFSADPADDRWSAATDGRVVAVDTSETCGKIAASGDVTDLARALLAGASRRDLHQRLRPLPVSLAAVLQVAATFGDFETFWVQLCKPGSITVLTAGSAGLAEAVSQCLQALSAAYSKLQDPASRPFVFTVKRALAAKPDHTTERPFAQLHVDLAQALQTSAPVVLVAASSNHTSQAVEALAPAHIALTDWDQSLMLAYLAFSYGLASEADLLELADQVATACAGQAMNDLGLEALILLARAHTKPAAVALLAERLCPDTSSHDLQNLAGFPLAPEVRETVGQMVSDLKDWQKGLIKWDDVMRGVLLYGPTGSGKTQVARLLANEAGITVHAGSLLQWIASGERGSSTYVAMRRFFETAAEQAPCVVFIDELDAIGDRDRAPDHNSAWTNGVVTALLECLDGFDGKEGIVMLAATNHLDKIDAAIKRPGRFDKAVRVDYPTITLMPEVLRWHLKDDLTGHDIVPLAQQLFGLSGAAVEGLVKEARARARRAQHPLTLDDLTDVISERYPPLASDRRRVAAIHEAGHAIVAAATQSG